MDITFSIRNEYIYYLKATHILEKINVLYITYFCVGKYSFRLDTFLTHLLFWKKLTFQSLLTSSLANTASVLKLFEHIGIYIYTSTLI